MNYKNCEVFYPKTRLKDGNKVDLWLEGERLKKAGFIVGAKYITVYDVDNQTLDFVLMKQGGTHVVSHRTASPDYPILNLCNLKLTKMFGEAARVRVAFGEGRIRVSLHHLDKKRIEREKNIREHLQAGYITEGSMCTGIGVSTHAMKAGFELRGIRSHVDWVVEMEPKYLKIAEANNNAIDHNTRLLCGTLEELEVAFISQVDSATVSLPCTGHSNQGKAKNGIKNAEEHDTAATSVFGFFSLLDAANPAILTSENVTQAMGSTTYTLIKQELERRGYVVYEKVLTAEDAGTIEQRSRYWMAAISSGLANFDFEDLPVFAPEHDCLGDLLEDVPYNAVGAHGGSPRWKMYQSLARKEERDSASGKNFARQFVDAATTKTVTQLRNYAKAGSNGSYVVDAPTGLQRLMQKGEMAATKRIPASLVRDCGFTEGHEGLGQSISYPQGVVMALRAIEGLLGKGLTTQAITTQFCEDYTPDDWKVSEQAIETFTDKMNQRIEALTKGGLPDNILSQYTDEAESLKVLISALQGESGKGHDSVDQTPIPGAHMEMQMVLGF
jgi:DNA (cytosine-5)-methyltransferase 1